MEKLVQIQNLSISFMTRAGEVQAVRDVSFSIGKGECVALVGESGCGKTVTSKAIMGLHQGKNVKIGVNSKIDFENKNILTYSQKEWQMFRGAKASMVFQDAMTALNPTMRIGKQIAECLMLHQKMGRREAMKRAEELLTKVGIPDARDRIRSYPHELSGGMRQRVVIAMAISCNPELMIADEPTTALDVTIQSQILKLIKEQQKERNMSVLFITHDLGIVAGMADKVVVMYNGKIVEKGPTDVIFANALHPYTTALLKSSPRVDQENEKRRLYSIGGMPPSLIDPPKGCPFAMRCTEARKICTEKYPEKTEDTSKHEVYCWKFCEDR